MAKEKFHCAVITPEAKVYDGEADFVAIPAHDGEIGILRDRAPLICQLGAGKLTVVNGDQRLIWFIDAGFAQVIDNRVTVLSQRALKPEQIDKAAAARQLEEARHLPITDEIAAKQKAKAEASARAQLHLAK